MWNIKKFKTARAQTNWIDANSYRFQIVVLYVNNGYAVKYKILRRVY